ncbi:ABC transporter ATP-binding protein [Formosa algae]|uniref:Nitrate/nitrite transport system ATP-binding protein n=1 Tax=Formosa algae TaxID=225843 RepID=A0A9X0YJM8_9FLAO|nr:ABC transporter ATP-binding protein [Formosa algae]MBP1839801.1 nitrate/nitrite transport system ATP-binding protein [Formosa algae]MDQ0335400.1 nitrate/nitrite transport system ATP-binding protein [Formosa algae]OEI79209.1 bacitracin ABC transporter ATP-binding protein [Formosa algae]PNW28017.1 bacitracin ABC transporter ATP-binding protein [Formosa algae]
MNLKSTIIKQPTVPGENGIIYPSANVMLDLNQLKKVYPTPKGDYVVLEDLNLKIMKEEFVTIIGHSGCGKTTMLSMIAGLNEISGGSISVLGNRIKGPGPDRGVIFQSPSLMPWMTALQNVLLGVNQVFPDATKAQRNDIAKYYLQKVGLEDAFHKKAADLSQGMQQRVGIARAFAIKPKVLLLDEPFGMLDSLTRGELQDILIEIWNKEKITAVMITHDVDEAIFLADRVVMMTSGPKAKIGDVLNIEFERPRTRKSVLEHDDYYKYRKHLIDFLEH